ncbi:uroporphyrinogen-III synthase [Bacillus sp. FJAT-49732]|uniref:Uroporphyrinogen-III synthase n=1 Tax=Lederbergia citrisecunda TaxID=2833583 RepID=A0A942YJY4_9BACI|nr:uroporphyrinogen-III synthase [Lederbergia citrisecunda]MBS4199833.1 uroporphyrinogen-III synthase [Lederbergia citrisecunda]
MRSRELPLKGKHVLITRGGEQGEKFCMDVASSGGVPHMVPLIDFRAHHDQNASYFVKTLNHYEWIIFTSKNGVHYFFQQIKGLVDEHLFHDGNIQFAVVGEKTKEALHRYRLPSRFMPNVYTAEDFAREFFDQGLTGKKVLIPKGNLASTTIADSFRVRGFTADEWIVYETYYPSKETDKLVQMLEEDLLDVAAFTSPSTFNHFMKIVNQHHLTKHAKQLLYAAIGTVTKRTIEQSGYTTHICPKTFTIDDMFNEICLYVKKQVDEGKD